MKRNTLKLCIILALYLITIDMSGQNANSIWQNASVEETEQETKAFRNTSPEEFQLFKLNTQNLKNILDTAPVRFSENSNAIIELPAANGELQSFQVYKASVLAPELQARHLNIQSFVAQGVDDPSAIARFSLASDGLHVMISSANYSTLYIDPYTQDKNYYISYAIKSLPEDLRSFECLVSETVENDLARSPENADDGMLRTFRLALACTGEYAQFHLTNQGVPPTATDAVKKAAVLAAMNTAMTRVNGIYERDIAVTMEIIPNNEDIIYLIAGTDPYTNNSGGTMLGQNQSTCDMVIGSANYDIGHVFSTGGGGVAGLGVVCVNGAKARGVTGLNSPIGDFFYVDFVSHEIGHQFRGNHTQNNACQRNPATAMEPGSASTIMGYAGICPPNVQGTSDDYFHAITIQEFWFFLTMGGGQCAVQTPTNNLPPTADAGTNTNIPKSTPFILRGVATDPDVGNVLTHSWEQMDPQVATMPPVNTSTIGPMFRSLDPQPTPDRYMPALATVLAGQTQSTWEVVPSVGRIMTFRYTVRDNVAGGASSASAQMIAIVDGASGPFVVTSQGAATTWQTQTTETITWDVAGTDVAPVDSPNVDILFSTDGGQTYPVMVADDIPNNGSAIVNVPNLNTTTGRFMVISSNNIFYDINDGVITVQGVILNTNDIEFADLAIYPNPSDGAIHITFTPTTAAKVSISLIDIKGRQISTKGFEPDGSVFNQTVNYSGLDTGIYFVKISTNGKNQTKKLIIK